MALIETLQKILPAQGRTDTANEKWLNALAGLFKACEPITSNWKLNSAEVKKLNKDIELHTFYCLHVKLALQDGVEPASWETWREKEKSFEVTATAEVKNPGKGPLRSSPNLEPIDQQVFSDLLTDMFDGEYPTKTPKNKKRDINFREQPLGDDVRMTAKYGRRDED